MERLIELPQNQETGKRETELVNPRDIAFMTTTFYKNWQPLPEGATRDADDADGIRGDLAIKTLASAKENGFQVAIVDGGSTDAFRSALTDIIGKPASDEKQRGMSPSRRQVFGEASALQDAKVLVWAEPEKVSMAQADNIQKAAKPIIEGRADVVIPKRDDAAFSTYPEYQVTWEKEANSKFNKLLRKNGLLPDNMDDLDAWFGPRLFKNSPEITKLFMHQWERDDTRPDKKDKRMDPELWANATFLPVVATLYRDKLAGHSPRVVSVPVNYVHPAEQTANEQDSPDFAAKREQQSDNILEATRALIAVFNYDANHENPLYHPANRETDTIK